MLELLAQATHTNAEHAPIELELGLARTAPNANPAPLPLQMGPALDQSSREVLKPRQLNLELAFMAARPLGEDIENQFRAIKYRAVPQAAQVALLDRRELLIEDCQGSACCSQTGTHLFGFAGAQKQSGISPFTPRLDALHNVKTRRYCQSRQFFERSRVGPLAADRDRNQKAANRLLRSRTQFSVLSWE
jgi:hypothetical protein